MNCPLCQCENLERIYTARDFPVFQNKVYPSRRAALKAKTANVFLMMCTRCDFIFNIEFDSRYMAYDSGYQNEQAHSPYFQTYLDEVIDLLIHAGFRNSKIIEIGCGKGYFFERLQHKGFQVAGFDPAYEGDNPAIIKDYFSEKYASLSGDLVILRHTLEHVQDPLHFLHNIAAALEYKGKIFIEVPRVEWIIEKSAFWDFFYEHCNYFSIDNLSFLFQDAAKGPLFNGQYMYLLADLSQLKKSIKPSLSKFSHRQLTDQFQKKIDCYKDFIISHQGILVWGAGAKGATFVNLLDPGRKFISGVLDINPRKQLKYIARTGHQVFSPEVLKNDLPKREILVMNENYIEEISNIVSDTGDTLYTLGDL